MVPSVYECRQGPVPGPGVGSVQSVPPPVPHLHPDETLVLSTPPQARPALVDTHDAGRQDLHGVGGLLLATDELEYCPGQIIGHGRPFRLCVGTP